MHIAGFTLKNTYFWNKKQLLLKHESVQSILWSSDYSFQAIKPKIYLEVSPRPLKVARSSFSWWVGLYLAAPWDKHVSDVSLRWEWRAFQLNGIKSRLVILLAIVLTKYFAIHHTITHHRPYPPPDPTETKLAYLHCISFLQREGQSW